jgi:hypothetical protein
MNTSLGRIHVKRTLPVLLLAGSVLAPASGQAAPLDSRRVAFWMSAGVGPVRANVGYVTFTGGQVRLDPETRVAVDGIVGAVMWSAEGRSVTFYDTGRERFRVIRTVPEPGPGVIDVASADPEQVEDRGAWLEGRNPVTMLDPGNEPTPPETWAGVPLDVVEVRNVRFLQDGRNISRYVTALTHHPRSGGVIAVHPYDVVPLPGCQDPPCTGRVYRDAYVARVNRSLEVTERIGGFGGARHLALTVGGTRLAFVNKGQTRAKVVTFPGLDPIRSYPASPGAKVSFTPRGILAITSATQMDFREPDGDLMEYNLGGVTRLRFAPCVGDGCLSFP